ncbi:MAG: Ig-like domain-containing protein [Bacteroidaceae bacterium]|nr:Ig-like domain-containing protein [Bacteroidaceae bacterium]
MGDKKEIRKRNVRRGLCFSLLCFLIVSCANLGTPDGGPYDETPPQIVRTSPEFGATGAHARKVVLEFDENIKVENAAEKVIVSPPQMEQPEISASGKRITIELMDSLREGVTYTIDFADAIEDNNEGNPMGDYAFTFSTGESIDTMQVSGYVLDAQNLEPIKGISVGLYALDDSLTQLPDSVFKTKPFERISRTDSRGHFIVKGLKRGRYQAYALKDQDQTYSFTQKAEMLAYNNQVFTPSCKPDLRPDTVWHDSLHYDSIIMRGYTHFYPDDIVLLAFNEKLTDRYLLKTERPNLREFSLFFTSGSDTLPVIQGLNFNADNAFVIESNQENDTIKYWIRDSLIYNLDTLEITLTYMATDTLGQLNEQCDTLSLVSVVSKAKTDKQQQEAYEKWAKEYKSEQKKERKRAKLEGTLEGDEQDKKKSKKKDDEEDTEIPPMPEEFLDFKMSNASLDPDKNFDFTFTDPIDTVYQDAIRFYEKVDTVLQPCEFVFRQLPTPHNAYRLYAEWTPGHEYVVEIDTGAFVSIYGKRNESISRNIRVKKLDDYGALFINLRGVDSCAVIQLLSNDKVVKTVKAEGNKAEFYYVNPGTYYLRMFVDRNGNGVWDTGAYDEQLQPEDVYYYPRSLELRAMWDMSQDWNPTATPRFRQKPLAITKQKPDKEKQAKNRNAEREKNKKNNK